MSTCRACGTSISDDRDLELFVPSQLRVSKHKRVCKHCQKKMRAKRLEDLRNPHNPPKSITCNKCGILSPWKTAHDLFTYDRGNKSGFSSECRICAKARRTTHKEPKKGKSYTELVAQGVNRFFAQQTLRYRVPSGVVNRECCVCGCMGNTMYYRWENVLYRKNVSVFCRTHFKEYKERVPTNKYDDIKLDICVLEEDIRGTRPPTLFVKLIASTNDSITYRNCMHKNPWKEGKARPVTLVEVCHYKTLLNEDILAHIVDLIDFGTHTTIAFPLQVQGLTEEQLVRLLDGQLGHRKHKVRLIEPTSEQYVYIR